MDNKLKLSHLYDLLLSHSHVVYKATQNSNDTDAQRRMSVSLDNMKAVVRQHGFEDKIDWEN